MSTAKAKVTIDERGMDAMADRLARRGMARLADEAMAFAQEQTPVDTGRLRAGMYAMVFVDGREVWAQGPRPSNPPIKGVGVEVIVGNDVDYARLVHDGTVDTEAHPFLAAAMAFIRTRGPGLVAEGMGAR